jgi:hypothetical protein
MMFVCQSMAVRGSSARHASPSRSDVKTTNLTYSKRNRTVPIAWKMRRNIYLSDVELDHRLHLLPTFVVARAFTNTQSTGNGIRSPNHRSLSHVAFAEHPRTETLRWNNWILLRAASHCGLLHCIVAVQGWAEYERGAHKIMDPKNRSLISKPASEKEAQARFNISLSIQLPGGRYCACCRDARAIRLNLPRLIRLHPLAGTPPPCSDQPALLTCRQNRQQCTTPGQAESAKRPRA